LTEVISAHPIELEALSGLRFFSSVPQADLESLAPLLRRRSYKKGEVIYHQEDPPGGLFIILKGIVKMQLVAPSGKLLTIAWMTPGRFFGTASLFLDGARPEEAVAVEACELLLLSRDHLRSFLRQYPDAMDAFLEVLVGRWRDNIERMRDMVFLDVPGRIAKSLLYFSKRPAHDREGSTLVEKLNQHELACLAGTSRESVNKWLHFFARQKWIEVQGGRIRILEPEALRGYTSSL
jgi:CRP/FNR family transcriptional regulator/CRP/FNR family cyclic AMP-dependent transcriptional regulator